MWTPATALLWEWWRMTRGQLLFCAALGSFAGWALQARVTNAGSDPREAYVVFMLLVGVATLAWVSMLARTAGRGFPLTLAYSRPISTWLLVAVPMFFLALACAATYALPAAALRLAYGAPLPLLPVAVLLAAGAALFCAGGWFIRSNAARFAVTVAFVVGLGPALRLLKPWVATPVAAFPPPLTTDSVQLSATDYALIALAVGIAYGICVRGVNGQRHGDGIAPAATAAAATASTAATKGMVEHFRDFALAFVRVPCPTSSPLVAELWIEMKARGLPVLAIGIALAATMPPLFLFSEAIGWGALVFIGFAAILPFFAGISASFWNRESSLRAPMSGFEAVRPVTTARLAAVQITVAVTSMFGAWLLMGAGAWWSVPLFNDALGLAPMQRALAAALGAMSVVRLVAIVVAAVTTFAAFVALLAAVRALSVRYGLRLWGGALALVVYLVGFAFFAGGRQWSGAAIGAHLWALAAAIPALTALATARALSARALLPRHAAVLAMAWALFAAALVLGWSLDASAFADLAPAVAALALASLLLPFTAGVVAVWSLDVIRHA